ncbi:hypothetical protein MVEN_01069400 [Mycena venus]|uniref:Uncharacterized protein n=1 Tax=Mycena venus TaxID=2733690 RepID=A0A8H6Y448_9AGAR|nr:hypothetical protein MVEN_01069400 [Mycena venus]
MASASSASSSSSRSASPEPEPTFAKATKSKAAEKAKKISQEKGRNEGVDPNWAYSPPNKSVRLEESADIGDFDWDELNGNPDLELWLVRIPEGVKPKYLETAQLEFPPGAKRDSKKSAKLGMLQRKHVAYDIWSVGDDEPEELPISGEEVKGLSCLLPRKSKKGKLYTAPTPIARTIVMSAQPVKPTPDPSAASSSNARAVYKNPPRESHPQELLTHRFLPYGAADPTEGSETGPRRATTPMAVDSEVLVPETPTSPSKSKEDKKGGRQEVQGEEAKRRGGRRVAQKAEKGQDSLVA